MSFNTIKFPQYELSNSALSLLDLFTEHLGANMFVADKNGDIVYANENAAATYQCSLDEIFKNFNAFTMYEKGITDRTPAVREVLEGEKEVIRYIKTGKNIGMVIVRGVEILAYKAEISAEGMALKKSLPVTL